MDEQYLKDLYDWLSTKDPSYVKEIPFNKFKSSMQEEDYAKQMYDWFGTMDETFKQDVPVDTFIKKVSLKKKDPREIVQTPYTKPSQESLDLQSEDGPSVSTIAKEIPFDPSIKQPGENYETETSQFNKHVSEVETPYEQPIRTVGGLLAAKNVTPEQMGMPADINPDKELSEDEIDFYKGKVKTMKLLEEQRAEEVRQWGRYEGLAYPLNWLRTITTSVNQGTEATVRNLAGANDIFNDAINSVIGVTGSERKMTGNAFTELADHIRDEKIEPYLDSNPNDFEKVLGGMAQLPTGFLLGLALMPAKNIYTIPTFMGIQGFTESYASGTEQGLSIGEKTKEGSKSFLRGATTGMMFELTGALGRSLMGESAEQIAAQTMKGTGSMIPLDPRNFTAVAGATDNAVLNSIGNATVNALGFATAEGVSINIFDKKPEGMSDYEWEQEKNKRKIDAGIMGAAFAIPALRGPMFGASVKLAMNAKPEVIKMVRGLGLTPDKNQMIRKRIMEIEDQIIKTQDKAEIEQLSNAKNALNNLLFINMGVEIINKDPNAVKDFIKTGDAPDNVKNDNIARINEIFEDNSPVFTPKNIKAKAEEFSNPDAFLASTTPKEQIQKWADVMMAKGKLDGETFDRIQKNIVSHQEATDLLNVGKSKGKPNKPELVTRMIDLLNARKELTSTETRAKFFSEKVAAINKEIAYISESKKIPKGEESADITEYASKSRQGIPLYEINKKELTREQFLEVIEKSTPEEIAAFKIKTKNDAEVTEIVREKLEPKAEVKAEEVYPNTLDHKETIETVKTDLQNDGESAFLYHYGPKEIGESGEFDPGKHGNNSITTENREVGGGASYFYAGKGKEPMVTGDLYAAKVPVKEIYPLSSDPRGLVPEIKAKMAEYDAKNGTTTPATPDNLAKFAPLVLRDLGYKGLYADWKDAKFESGRMDTKRIEMFEKIPVDKEATHKANKYRSANPDEVEVREVAKRDIESILTNALNRRSTMQPIKDILKSEGTTVEEILKSDLANNKPLDKIMELLDKDTQAEYKAIKEMLPKLDAVTQNVSILITPATVRSFSKLTDKISKMSLEFDRLIKEYNKTNDPALVSKINKLSDQILKGAKKEISDKIEQIEGVSVKFGEDFIGRWDGKFEPSLNMTIELGKNADTKSVSKMLAKFGEKYSQDAIIAETLSEKHKDYSEGKIRMPLNEFDENGHAHYPQIIYRFGEKLTNEQRSALSNKLEADGIEAFSINGNELKISVLTFLSEKQSKLSSEKQYNLKKDEYKRHAETAATAIGDVLGRQQMASGHVEIKRSHYEGAKNDGDKIEQFREYGRNNFLEKFKPKEVISDLLKLDTKDQTNLEKVHDYLDKLDKKLSSEINPNDMNDVVRVMGVKAAQAVVKTLKALVKTGITLQEAIKRASQEHNVSEEDIVDSLKKIAEMSPNKSEGISETELPGVNRMFKETQNQIDKASKRGFRGKDKLKENVMNYVKGSRVYTDATDVQRDLLVREVEKMFGKTIKSAPSVGRILGTVKDIKNVTMDEMDLIHEQIKFQNIGAKDVVKETKKIQGELITELGNLKREGKVTVNQALNIMKRFNKTNMLSSKSVSRFVDYMTKVFKDADYTKKLKEGEELNKKIKKLSKDIKRNADLRVLAKSFSGIDPSMVENIAEYNTIAVSVKEAIKGSSLSGNKVREANTVVADEVATYIKETLEKQREQEFKSLAAEMQEMMGIDASKMSYEEMMELMDAPAEKMTKYNESIVRSTINKMFDTYSAVINDIINTGKDSFTGESLEFKEKDIKTIGEFMDMDLDILSPKEALRAVDALKNFIANKSTAGMWNVIGGYTGEVNVRKAVEKGIMSQAMTLYWSGATGKYLAEQFFTAPMLFEFAFKGVRAGAIVEKMVGFTQLRNGKSMAEKKANNVVDDYLIKFHKEKPNGEDFNTARNITERGVIAHMSRNIFGTEAERAAEFKRRKGLVEESINALSKGTKEEKKEAEIYMEAYNRLLKDSKNIDDVKAQAHKVNIDAVDYWVKKWLDIYEDLADVSLNIYNRVLEADANYTPDTFRMLKRGGKPKDLLSNESSFHYSNGTVYKKQSGVLMEATRPNMLPRNEGSKVASRYLDLSFDKTNADAMYEALVDMHTARHIRQTEAFINSDSFYDIMHSVDDANVIKNRMELYTKNIRNKHLFTDDELSKSLKKLNTISSIGAGMALGGITQPIKQVVPVAINTLINAHGLDVSYLLDKNFHKFLEESGYAVSNRGVQSMTQMKNLNKLMDINNETAFGKTIKGVENLNKKWLKTFLVNADVMIARMAWKTYYEKALKDQGIKDVDYKDHKLNESAADYAQRMVDRQQNISDSDLQGAWYSSKDPFKQFVTKVALSFANFRINQTMRLYTDITTLSSRTSAKEDKAIARTSLAGYAAEMATFRVLSTAFSLGLMNLSYNMLGKGDDEEVLEKKKDAIIKGQISSTVTDILSPLPPADVPVAMLFNGALNGIQTLMDTPDEEKLSIYAGSNVDFIKSMGVLGIPMDRAASLYNIGKMAATGETKDKYGKVKQISDDDKGALGPLFVLSLMTNLGLAPSEVASVVRYSVGAIQKSAKATPKEKEDKSDGMNKSDMKRYHPEEYKEMYPEDEDNEQDQERKEMLKEQREERDREEGYIPPAKKKKKKKTRHYTIERSSNYSYSRKR